ncbi:hypothetical protein GpSGHVEth063 [Glossina pallidipes salivary gland hypertrophy virus]|uniref:Uncharacterized protein n=1 Tax=Glossina hytrovirus (isolate Glossina pallidipes/Ethiopia/Seibersdorf/-) TaxID=379529 RepID=A0A0Y0K7B9_GHVS|nr:hypothetical protein GpSGHVEth063 [Glossina pallidipes salivary gland hypertrophy virus]
MSPDESSNVFHVKTLAVGCIKSRDDRFADGKTKKCMDKKLVDRGEGEKQCMDKKLVDRGKGEKQGGKEIIIGTCNEWEEDGNIPIYILYIY